MNAGGSGTNQLSTAAVAALQTGNKIEAIKITRQERGVDLKQAKDWVEAYIAANPAIQEQLRPSSSGALGWLFMIIIAIAAIVYFWPK